MHNTIVVNAFGGAGAGKTTACFYLACELKKRGYVAEYVPEYAKELVWDENLAMLDGSIPNQTQLFFEQKKRIDRLIGKVEFVVTDSPILLNGIYLKECPEKERYCANVLKIFKSYNNFNVLVQRDSTKYEQQGRIHTFSQSMEIDGKIKKMLDDNHLYYGTYTHRTLDKIVNNIITTHDRQAHEIVENTNCAELDEMEL